MRREWKVSIRRACVVLRARRSTYHYRHRRREQADLGKRIKEIAQTRVRRNKTPKRRVKAKLREDRTVAMRRNEIWAMDFVHDQLATGRKLRVLTVVDLFSRFSPAVDPAFSYKGSDVVQTLERICRDVGYPKVIRVDQGSEFISRDLDLWAYQNEVTLDFSRPGKPTDNAFIEVLQRHLPRRVPERALVHEPCRRTAKNGRLAQRLQ